MIEFFSTHSYLQWVLWSIWLPIVVLWALFYRTLIKYPKTFIKVVAGSLLFGITWDYVAIRTNIWSYPTGCCMEQRIWRLPLEEPIWIVSAAILISTLTILLYTFTHKKGSRI